MMVYCGVRNGVRVHVGDLFLKLSEVSNDDIILLGLGKKLISDLWLGWDSMLLG